MLPRILVRSVSRSPSCQSFSPLPIYRAYHGPNISIADPAPQRGRPSSISLNPHPMDPGSSPPPSTGGTPPPPPQETPAATVASASSSPDASPSINQTPPVPVVPTAYEHPNDPPDAHTVLPTPGGPQPSPYAHPPFDTHRFFAALEKTFPTPTARSLMRATRALLVDRIGRVRREALTVKDLESVSIYIGVP